MFEVRFRYDMVSDNFISSVVQFHKKSKKKKCEFILKGVANDFPRFPKYYLKEDSVVHQSLDLKYNPFECLQTY